MDEKILLNHQDIDLTITRLCWELIENHDEFAELCLIGLQPRGVFFADRIVEKLSELTDTSSLSYGKLDITFFRDDFRRREDMLIANQTDISFQIENKSVVFIDDVLFTGRSIRSALNAIGSFGRPKRIELMTLINRRFSRELPIFPKYIGREVDAIDSERVKVSWASEKEEKDFVSILKTGK
ncbi:MAG: bifunctional pyr operon transcriptional regulator/uracil phosphoribosyltransferase PyrR [Flavobacteriales bacterium]